MPAASRPTLLRLRRRLHALAELSGQETQTAGFVAEELERCRPAEVISGLGGPGGWAWPRCSGPPNPDPR